MNAVRLTTCECIEREPPREVLTHRPADDAAVSLLASLPRMHAARMHAAVDQKQRE